MRKNIIGAISLSIFVIIFLGYVFLIKSCQNGSTLRLSVENTTPQRTEVSLKPNNTTITLAPGKDMSREQLRVVSWLYLQQIMYDDYALQLSHQQQVEHSERRFQAVLGIFVAVISGGLGAFYLYLTYLERYKN